MYSVPIWQYIVIGAANSALSKVLASKMGKIGLVLWLTGIIFFGMWIALRLKGDIEASKAYCVGAWLMLIVASVLLIVVRFS